MKIKPLYKIAASAALWYGSLFATMPFEAGSTNLIAVPPAEEILAQYTASSHKKHCSGTLTMTLDISTDGNVPLDEPFNLEVAYEVFGSVVTLHIPSFNFTVPTGNMGYVYTVAGFLPRELWPNDPLYQSFFCALNTLEEVGQIQVSNAGSLIFMKNEEIWFSEGAHAVQPTTISYFLTGSILDCRPPKSVPVTSDTSNATLTDYSGEFGRSHDISFYDNQFALWWPDNSASTSPNGRNHLSAAVRTGIFENGKIKFNGSSKIAIPADENVFFYDGAISINPTNPQNIAVACVGIDLNWAAAAASGDPAGQRNYRVIWISVSNDGGQTWNARRLDDGVNVPYYTYSGPSLFFDKYGNLWLYKTGSANGNSVTLNLISPFSFFDEITLSASIDGGASFSLVATGFAPIPADPSAFPPQFVDLFVHPKATFGGDGQGGEGVWGVSLYAFIGFDSGFNLDVLGSQAITFLPVYGYNNFGSSITPLLIPQGQIQQISDLPTLSYSEIAVSDLGETLLVGPMTNTIPSSPVGCAFNSTGTALFDLMNGTTGEAFTAPYYLARSNQSLVSFLTTVPFQPNAGFFQRASGLAYDPDLGRFYTGIIDMQPLAPSTDEPHNMVLYLLYTDNGGQTWSKPTLISDSIKQARGLLNMSRDPVSGNLLFSWADALHQSDQSNVNAYMTVLPKSFLDKLPRATSRSLFSLTGDVNAFEDTKVKPINGLLPMDKIKELLKENLIPYVPSLPNNG